MEISQYVLILLGIRMVISEFSFMYVYQARDVSTIKIFRNSNETCDIETGIFGNSLIDNLKIMELLSQNDESYIFTENLSNIVVQMLSKSHLKLPYYAQKFRQEVKETHEHSLTNHICIDESYISIYLKIISFFPTKQLIILFENASCHQRFQQKLNEVLSKDQFVISIVTSLGNINKILQILSVSGNLFIYIGSKDTLAYILLQIRFKNIDSTENIFVTQEIAFERELLPYNTILIQNQQYRTFQPSRSANSSYIATAKDCHLQEEKERKRTIFVKTWHKNHIDLLLEANIESRTVKFLIHSNEFTVSKATKPRRTLRAVSIIDGPFLAELDYLYDWETKQCEGGSTICHKWNKETKIWFNTCCFGYVADLYNRIANLLDADLELYNMPGMIYGGYNENTSSFNGMVGAISRKEFDIATPLTINTKRLTAVDFSTPFIEMDIAIATKIKFESDGLFNKQFVAHLDYSSIIGTFLFFHISIFLIYAYDNTVLLQKFHASFFLSIRKHFKKYSLEESFSYVAGILFQRDIGGKNPVTLAGRSVAIFSAFGMVALITLYTASLTVDQVTKNKVEDFKGLQDERIQKPTDKFTFATVADTSTVAYFRNSRNPNFQRIGKFMEKYDVDDAIKGVQKVLNNELGAMLYDRHYLSYYIARNAACQVKLSADEFGKSSYGIAVKKNSKLKAELTNAILTLKDDKYLEKLKKKWLYLNCQETDQREFQTFEISFFGSPTAILVIVIILCAFILVIEILYKRLYLEKQSHYNIGY